MKVGDFALRQYKHLTAPVVEKRLTGMRQRVWACVMTKTHTRLFQVQYKQGSRQKGKRGINKQDT